MLKSRFISNYFFVNGLVMDNSLIYGKSAVFKRGTRDAAMIWFGFPSGSGRRPESDAQGRQ
jgi:hypothetical protein